MRQLMKKIKNFFKNDDSDSLTRDDIARLKELVDETSRLCREMQSNVYLIEVTKAQQKTLIGLTEQINTYERIMLGQSMVHRPESEQLN